MLKTIDLKKNYGELEVLRGISTEIKKGEVVSLIGPSGSGKSTFLRCLNYTEIPSFGEVYFKGQKLSEKEGKDFDINKVRASMGMVFQHFNLFPNMDVLGNITLAPMKAKGLSLSEAKKTAERLLDKIGLSDKINAFPSQLSGGQKQRVAIARALANDPDVLLCDEATSALDPQTTKSILALLKKLNNTLGLTIVIITHEMAVVKEVCDKVAVMENGKVVESGSVFSIFANPKEAVTRDFIRTTSNLHKIDDLINDHANVVALKPGELIVRLSYVESNTSEPLISTVSRKFNIDVNIIYADVEIIKDAPIGGTVAIISGKREDISEAVLYLLDKNVHVEVLKDARISN